MSQLNKKDDIILRWWKDGFLTLSNIRDIVLVSLIMVITWKLVNSEIKIRLESFSFTDLLSVLLAFFAIALSAAFYFKATETSNRFYDNSYKFTKEMSEILGRIESGFGEKLKHIDEGYNGLSKKFDNIPFDIKEAKEEESKEEKNIEEQEKKRERIILDLIEKAKFADSEKEEVLSKLKQSSRELDESKHELRQLQRRINMVESDIGDVGQSFIEYLSQKMAGRFLSEYNDAPIRILNKHFVRMKEEKILDNTDLRFMDSKGLISDEGLTLKGAHVFRQAIERSIG